MKKVMLLFLFEMDDDTDEQEMREQFSQAGVMLEQHPHGLELSGRQISRMIDTNAFWGVDIRGFVADQDTLAPIPTRSFTVAEIIHDPENPLFYHAVGPYDPVSNTYAGHRMFHIINPIPVPGDFIEVWVDDDTCPQRTTVNGEDVIV